MTDAHERTPDGPDRPDATTPELPDVVAESTDAAPRPADLGPDARMPVEPESVDPEPVDRDPVEPESVDPESVDPESVDPEPVDPEPVDPEPPADAPAVAASAEAGSGRRRRRLSAAGAVIGLLVGLLGFAFVVQLRSNSTDQQLSADRPEDLVRILSDLDARKDRLSQEINTLQNTQQQLAAGSQSRQAALAEASRRADELGILAGTLPAQGPGLRVEFRAAAKPIQASDLLDAVEELRGAGAEAMQISGTNNVTARIVASSSFVDGAGGGLIVDGTAMSGPFTVTVIGDPQTMQIALNIPSGVVDTVHHNGGNVTIASASMVEVSALHPVTNPRFAQPAG